MEQMGGIETPSANLLRIFETEKDDLVSVNWTFFYLGGLFCCFLLFYFRRWRLFLVVVNAFNYLRLRDALVFLRREVEADLVRAVHFDHERLAHWEARHMACFVVLILARVAAAVVVLNLIFLIGLHYSGLEKV